MFYDQVISSHIPGRVAKCSEQRERPDIFTFTLVACSGNENADIGVF